LATNFLKMLQIHSKSPRAFFGMLLMAFATACGLAGAASSVSQYGITWTFSQDRPVGQFVTGGSSAP
jgi:hypothetical protein